MLSAVSAKLICLLCNLFLCHVRLVNLAVINSAHEGYFFTIFFYQLRQIVAPPGMRTAVLMGDELSEELPGVAIAAKRYLAGGGRSGTIALLGPSRMPYLTVLPKLEYFAEKLGRAMTRAEK